MSIDQGRHALGIDFGTSNTVAIARWPDGRARPILVDGSPLLPSAVYAETSGLLLVGRDAVHSARRDPARYEPNPKRRIDDESVLLGDREIEVVDLMAAVLVRVLEEWHRAVGPVRPETTLTCPATWGSTRRGLLAEAAARAGLERARLVAEPVAAATYFAEVLGRDVPIGSVVVVHDFGAGTFDASVVARTAEGFEELAVDGRDDLGGLDIDAAIVEHLGATIAQRDAGVWKRLTEPVTLEDRRAKRQLWDDARIAKERLSRAQAADVMIPLLDEELQLTREELESLARPILDQTVTVTRDLLRYVDLAEGRLAGVFLVGGASRIPLIATLLHRELGEPPVVIEQPELVVAEGSIPASAAMLASDPAAPGPTSLMKLPPRGELAAAAESVSGSVPVPDASASGVSGSATSGRLGSGPGSVDDETVPQSRMNAPDGVPPAVDPWPDAQHHWVPDPDATVPSSPFPIVRPISSPPQQTSPAPARPVSPGSYASAPVRPGSPHSGSPHSGSLHSGAGSSGAGSVGVGGPGAGGAAGSVHSGQVLSGQVTRGPRSRQLTPPPQARRATSSGTRAVQIVLSALLMVAVPIVAMLATFCAVTGVPVKYSMTILIDDFSRLIGG
jgi:molecular chaperone DnaK